MKRFLIVTLTMVFVLGLMGGTALAASDTGLEESPAFEGDTGHWTNENNEDVRFDTDTHRRAIPGEGGENSDEDSAVIDRDDNECLVDPHDTK